MDQFLASPMPLTEKHDIRAPGSLSGLQALGWRWHRVIALLLSDCLAIGLAWRIAAQLNRRFYAPIPPELKWWVWLGLPSLFWIFLATSLVLFAYNGLYSPSSRGRNYVRSGQVVSLVYLSSLVISYFYDPKLDVPRSLFFAAWCSSVAFVIGFRLLTMLILKQFEQSQSHTLVFLLAPPDRQKMLTQILQKQSNCFLVGTASSLDSNHPETLKLILQSGAEEVVAEGLPQSPLASALYWQLRRAGITLRLIPSSLETLHRRGMPEVFAGLPTLRVETPAPLLNGLDYRVKRWMDWGGALVGLLLLSPLLIGIAIAIKLCSPGSVFYCQERMGLHGKVFQMWKFRTMIPNADRLQEKLEAQNETDGVMFKIKQDPRIIPVIGHFLRRTSLDELPQLINVLQGQMSLVGPRPLPLRDVQRFDQWHHIRHQVLPGITGLWQISGRSELQDFRDVVRLDLYYIDNWSLNLDLDILVETCRIVLFGKGAY